MSESVCRKMFKCWTLGYILLQSTIITSANHEALSSAPQDLEDTVQINFPRNLNTSRAIARQLYLPPDEFTFTLPEVIDNRVRSVFPRPTLPPEIRLKAPNPSDPLKHIYNINTTPKQSPKSPKTSDPSNSITINSMSCKNADDDVYFRASLAPLNLGDAPVAEGTGSEACRIEKINQDFKIDFTGDLFWNCGVQDCSNDSGKFYCLNLRFPAIPGLRLKEDTKILLRCRTQERTTSHIKRFNLKTVDTSARMAARVATGGHKNAFDTDIGLYRKTFGSDHLFDAKIQPGGTVILGEDILLRVVVRDGDGWKFSRISDVTINYVESKRQKRIMNSVWILDSNGCINPDVREICSREQYRVSALEGYLIFQAFMFDSMRESDELIMNVKVTGCLEGNDCAINCPIGHSRKTRSLEYSRNNTRDWLNDISFRVATNNREDLRFSSQSMIIPYMLSSLILVVIGALLCTIKVMKNQKIERIMI